MKRKRWSMLNLVRKMKNESNHNGIHFTDQADKSVGWGRNREGWP